jgi:hypothetical protein
VWKALGHWPLLLAAVLAIAFGVALLADSPNGEEAASAALLAIGAILLGAFIVTTQKDKP